MIKANELRIGNWVHLDVSSRCLFETIPIKITQKDFNLYGTSALHQPGEITLLYPIPLTPEILEKCGFEKKGGDYTIKANDIKFLGFFYENYFVTLFNGERFVDLEYLHQLQNLYFALTGEELPVENLMPESKDPVNVHP